MTAAAWVTRVFGLLLTVSPSLSADEIEIVGRLQIQAQLEAAGGRSRVSGRLLDELGRPIQGSLVVRATDPSPPVALEPCLLDTDSNDWTTHITSSPQGDFCAWLKQEENPVSIFASAEHYQTTHIQLQLDQSPLLSPRFVSAPTLLLRGSEQMNTVELRATAADPMPSNTQQIELALRCHSARTSLGKQAVSSSRVVFEFVTPPDAALGTCQLQAASTALGKTSALAQVDVLVQAEVTVMVSRVEVHGASATVELVALAGEDVPHGALEAARGPSVLASVALRARGATVIEVPLLDQEGEVTFRVVPGSSEYMPGAPASVILPAAASVRPNWLWHALGAFCFLTWLSWRWLLAARPRTRPAPARPTPSLGQAIARPLSSGAIRGRVLDVHTQKPLGAVELTLVEPRADGETILESTVSDAEGAFQFEALFSRQLLRLRASRPHFMTLAASVTAADFVIELRSTRRAALESLIAWARRSGRPWDVTPSPTTGHVQQIAKQHHEPRVGAWAAEVERAAFGPNSPSELNVTELLDRSPQDRPKTSSF
jgi:hypothetical protein